MFSTNPCLLEHLLCEVTAPKGEKIGLGDKAEGSKLKVVQVFVLAQKDLNNSSLSFN